MYHSRYVYDYVCLSTPYVSIRRSRGFLIYASRVTRVDFDVRCSIPSQ